MSKEHEKSHGHAEKEEEKPAHKKFAPGPAVKTRWNIDRGVHEHLDKDGHVTEAPKKEDKE